MKSLFIVLLVFGSTFAQAQQVRCSLHLSRVFDRSITIDVNGKEEYVLPDTSYKNRKIALAILNVLGCSNYVEGVTPSKTAVCKRGGFPKGDTIDIDDPARGVREWFFVYGNWSNNEPIINSEIDQMVAEGICKDGR